MIINIRTYGEPDTLPYAKTFQYSQNDDDIFIASVKRINEILARNLRINIDETLLYFSAYVVTSLKEGKSVNQIKEKISQLLSPNQVMIGVAEMLGKLELEIIFHDKTTKISINRPIATTAYLFKPI